MKESKRAYLLSQIEVRRLLPLGVVTDPRLCRVLEESSVGNVEEPSCPLGRVRLFRRKRRFSVSKVGRFERGDEAREKTKNDRLTSTPDGVHNGIRPSIITSI